MCLSKYAFPIWRLGTRESSSAFALFGLGADVGGGTLSGGLSSHYDYNNGAIDGSFGTEYLQD
ncbi:hypothetical protein LXN10_09255 [Arcobacter sp. KX21116]|uniref:hypothetical protein n=1 Tax=Arcobacter iocasae TaxID=2906515 RepID=UPI0035D451A8